MSVLTSVGIWRSSGMDVLRLLCGLVWLMMLAAAVKEREDSGDEDECGDGCECQTADDSATERSVLLASVAEAECHGNHTDDHRESGHEHRPEARRTGVDGCANGVAALKQTVLGEGDDKDGVGGGDAHAHDGSHQRGHGERGAREEEEEHDTGDGRG